MRSLLLVLFLAGVTAVAQDDTPVYRSDVSLVRVDVRVTGRDGRAVPHLTVKDFVLRDNDRIQPIRSFASEEMPLDVLFLIDVSGSMQSHVERLANASTQALATLAADDRAAVMVFDRSTRLRQPLTNSLEAVERDLRSIIRSEGFNGGTDITRALLDAARYIGKSGRKEARRAIVILTDDQTERDRDEFRVGQALRDADTVLSALLAPDAMMSGYPGGGYPGGGRYPSGRSPSGRYPGGSGGGWGDIIFGRRTPTGGGYPAPGGGGGGYPMPGGRSRTQSAGTAEIARASGGDSLPVDHASALQDTLDGLRQRYSLYFSVPPGAQAGQQRRLTVDLSSDAARRIPGAQLNFRDDYRAPGGAPPEAPETVTVSESVPQAAPAAPPPSSQPRLKRRPVGETYGSHGPNPDVGAGAPGTPQATPSPVPASPGQTGGWRKATEEDKQQAEAPKKDTPAKKD